jgi:hypothetical protein
MFLAVEAATGRNVMASKSVTVAEAVTVEVMTGLTMMASEAVLVANGKLLPLLQPQSRTRTYVHTCQSTQRATQPRGVLARAYYVPVQNLNTVINMTVP